MKLAFLLLLVFQAPTFLLALETSLRPEDSSSLRIPGPGCEDGIVLDDGSAETAYSWVPTVIQGEYVQTFPRQDLTSTILESACICWTRTRNDSELDFEIVIYRDAGGLPAEDPIMVIPEHAGDVPLWGDGAFYEYSLVDQTSPLGAGLYHIGVRWNPSIDQYFFLCADHTPRQDPVPGFFRDDRADGWGSVLDTGDSTFIDHAAMMIRLRADKIAWVPTLSRSGMLVLMGLILAAAWIALRIRN